MLEDYLYVHENLPWFFPSFFFLLGACVGSFLNVCIFRIPKGMSVVHPGSHDLNTGEKIAWYDNIPILSWFILGGKSRGERSPISFRYPMVEFMTACLFLCSWVLLVEHSIVLALAGMVLVAMLIPATFIDLDHMIIPDRFSIGLAGVGVIASFAFPDLHGVREAGIVGHMVAGLTGMIGLLIGTAVIYWIGTLAEVALQKPAMGEGDWKLLGGIGAFCGWQGALFSLFGGAFIGTLFLIPLMLFQGKGSDGGVNHESGEEKEKGGEDPASNSTPGDDEGEELRFGVQVPFGPMLALGAVLYFIFLRGAVDAYFDSLAPLFILESSIFPQ